MKKLDVFIVRFLPFGLFILICYIVINSRLGNTEIDYNAINQIHSNSFPYALALFLISLSDKKYHCIWNRAMYVELMVIPIINYINAKFHIFYDELSMIYFVSLTLILTLIATIILAVRHFIITRKRRTLTNGNKG